MLPLPAAPAPVLPLQGPRLVASSYPAVTHGSETFDPVNRIPPQLAHHRHLPTWETYVRFMLCQYTNACIDIASWTFGNKGRGPCQYVFPTTSTPITTTHTPLTTPCCLP